MYSYFISYLGFCLTEEDQIHNGTALHVCLFYTVSTVSADALKRRLKGPGHQQAWYWPHKPDYSISSIRRVNNSSNFLVLGVICWLWRHSLGAQREPTTHQVSKTQGMFDMWWWFSLKYPELSPHIFHIDVIYGVPFLNSGSSLFFYL